MKRREFTLSLGAAAVLTACGGGGGGGGTLGSGSPGSSPAPGPGGSPAPGAAAQIQFGIGTNLASMELGEAIRFGASTLPNVNFSVPRQQDIDYLRDNGFGKSRLPIRWEMLQPVLNDTNANAATLATIGVSAPGAFHPGYPRSSRRCSTPMRGQARSASSTCTTTAGTPTSCISPMAP